MIYRLSLVINRPYVKTLYQCIHVLVDEVPQSLDPLSELTPRWGLVTAPQMKIYTSIYIFMRFFAILGTPNLTALSNAKKYKSATD